MVGAPTAIQGNWMGVVELLAAARAKTEALSWLATAMPRVQAYAVMLAAGMPIVGQALVESALRTHFHLNPATPASTRVPAVNTILGMLERMRGTLRDSARTIRFRTDSEAVADGSADIAAAYTWPFPPSSATRINITRNFLQRSVRNRVSSLLHEAVHVNDAASVGPAGAPDPVHIPEWYVTAPEAARLGLPFVPNDPGFATRYDQMSAANALHNPAAYATLVRHLFFAVDNRELP